MEGAVAISVLYITADDDRPFALLEGVIPFSHEMEAEGIANECRFHLQPQLEQLTASMLGGEEVELKGTISLNLFAVRIRRQNCIRDIEEKELDLKKLQDTPGDRLLCGTAGGYAMGYCKKILYDSGASEETESDKRRNQAGAEASAGEICDGLKRTIDVFVFLVIQYRKNCIQNAKIRGANERNQAESNGKNQSRTGCTPEKRRWLS